MQEPSSDLQEPQFERDYQTWLGRFLDTLGTFFLSTQVGRVSTILAHSARVFFADARKGKLQTQQIIQQAYFTGIEAIPLIALISLLLGSLTILNAITVMPKVGFGDFFGNLMVVVINRELGPILTAFIIAGRTGSALAAYLSYMKVGQEVDALESMGIDPIRFLIMPAAVGAMIAVLMCTIIFNSVAIFIGFLVVQLFVVVYPDMFPVQFGWNIYSSSLLSALSWPDLIMTLIKPLVFGAVISANAAHHGISIGNDIRQIPQAASKSVVSSFIMIVILDLMLSTIWIIPYITTLGSII